MPSESLRVAFAYAHGNGNRDTYSYRGTEVDSFTTAPSHTAASTLRPALSSCFFGDSRVTAGPRNAYVC